MIIVNKQTLEIVPPQNLPSHIIWDFSNEEYLKLMLQANGYDIVTMPDCPMCDYDFYTPQAVNVRKVSNTYLADWELVPVDQPIELIAQKKLAQIKYNCGVEIVGGFYSSALGDSYFYSSDMESQANLQGNVLLSMAGEGIKHICYDSDKNRVIMPHTKEQIFQVGRDYSLHLWSKLEKYNALRVGIETALSVNDLETLLAVSWN
jgi:hypothetical protein